MARKRLSRSARIKLRTILLLDLVIVAVAAGGYLYVASLPGPPLPPENVQLLDLQVNPHTTLAGQPVKVTVNVTNIGSVNGVCNVTLLLDGAVFETRQLKLSAGETRQLEFAVASEEEGLHTVKIGDLEVAFTVTATYVLSDLAINRTEASIGEPVGITVKVASRAEEPVSYAVTLYINGSIVETKKGQLAPGESVTLLFEVVEQAEGTYTVKAGSLTGVFQVNPAAPPPKPAIFLYSNLTLDPEVSQPNEPVNITVRVANVGETSGSQTVNLAVNGQAAGSKTVQLQGGEAATVSFTYTPSAIGSYTISVGNLTVTLTVQGPSSIVLTGLVVRPYEVWGGDTVTVIAKALNNGSSTSSLAVKLKVDGTVVQTKSITLAAGTEGTVEFAVTAPPLQAGDQQLHVVDVQGMQGGFKVVKNGYHTLSVAITPNGDAKFTLIKSDGTREEHVTFWSALLPEGTYTVIMPQTDPTGRITFVSWDDGSTSLSRTVTLNKALSITATYTGGSSCPSLYVLNGTGYVYVAEISNHGWLGYIKWKNASRSEDVPFDFYRNNPWDYIPLDKSSLAVTDEGLKLLLLQRWNEIFYLDRAYLVVVDHPADVAVYSTMVEEYLDPAYMGQIYTVSLNPAPPVSAYNEKGENVLPQLSRIDGVFTPGINGVQSPSWDNITWNVLTLNLGNLTGASHIKLVVRAVVDWGSADDYGVWLSKFYDPAVPDGAEVTPPPVMEVKAANGSWVPVPIGRQFPIPPDGVPRTFVVDLTGLFPTDDYALRISNYWNVTFDFIGVDTTSPQNVTIQTVNPQAYLYQEFEPGQYAATGNFTRYGNVTQLLLEADDEFVIGRQGDAVSLVFPTSSLEAPASGMVRDYFFFVSCWFKDENGNWGFGFGFTVDPLPFQNMTGFPYPPTEHYPDDAEHIAYLAEWNTRIISPSE